MQVRHFASRLTALSFALLFAGCISAGDLSHTAIRYNEAVEDAQNKMLLLNVVRAELFRPMYITDLTKILGNIKLDINTGGIETDYGPYTTQLIKGTGGLTSGKLTPSVDYAHNPTFDVNVLSTQDFMKGFLAPVPKELLAYYWEQGWPQEFLLYLFVHRVHVRPIEANGEPGEPERVYENYPDPEDPDLTSLEDFGRWATQFVSTMPRFVRKGVNIGPCLSRDEVSDLDDLIKAAKEGLSITQAADESYQLQQPKQDLVLMSSEAAKEDKIKSSSRSTCDSSRKASEKPPDRSITKGKTPTEDITLDLRSPDGVLFYLGELMRAAEKFDKVPEACIGGKLWPIFVALNKHHGGRELNCPLLVGAVYEGKEFIIPDRKSPPANPASGDFKCPMIPVRSTDARDAKGVQLAEQTGRHKYVVGVEKLDCFGGMSSESFSLLGQLIALQKSAKDAPTTSVIRAIQ